MVQTCLSSSRPVSPNPALLWAEKTTGLPWIENVKREQKHLGELVDLSYFCCEKGTSVRFAVRSWGLSCPVECLSCSIREALGLIISINMEGGRRGSRPLRNTEQYKTSRQTPNSGLYSHMWPYRHFKYSLLTRGLSQSNFRCRHHLAFPQAPETCNAFLSTLGSLCPHPRHAIHPSLPRKEMLAQAW